MQDYEEDYSHYAGEDVLHQESTGGSFMSFFLVGFWQACLGHQSQNLSHFKTYHPSLIPS